MNRKVMYGFKNFTNFEVSMKLFREGTGRCSEREIVETKNSLGRISSTDIFSPVDLPSENRSVVDGYAVRSLDISSASPTNPVILKIVGKVYAGTVYRGTVGREEAVEIFTGGILPQGTDCVVMAEDCKVEGNELIVYRHCFSMQNVSRKGEDFAKGDKVLGAGTLIKPFHIGALISLGLKEIEVYRKARISVFSTGNELRDIESMNDGIIDSTRPMITSIIKEYGMEPLDMGIVKDDLYEITKKIEMAVKSSDMLVITGGTSIGEHDLVPEAIQSVARPGIVVHGISMRPARTTGFAFHGEKPILMISGFPVAAYISFTFFFREFIEKFYGTTLDPLPLVRGRISMRWPNQAGVRSFVRVVVRKEGDDYFVDPLRLTGSGILSTLTRANGIMIVNENSEGYEEGDYVDVFLTQSVEVKK